MELKDSDFDDEHPIDGAWRSQVARLLWEQDVGGSNPLAPTIFPRSVRAVSDTEGRAAAAGRHGVRIRDHKAAAGHRVDEIHFGILQVADADGVDKQCDAIRFKHLVRVAGALLNHQPVLEARAAAALHVHP